MDNEPMELLKAAVAEAETRQDRTQAEQTVARLYRIDEKINRIEYALKVPSQMRDDASNT